MFACSFLIRDVNVAGTPALSILKKSSEKESTIFTKSFIASDLPVRKSDLNLSTKSYNFFCKNIQSAQINAHTPIIPKINKLEK